MEELNNNKEFDSGIEFEEEVDIEQVQDIVPDVFPRLPVKTRHEETNVEQEKIYQFPEVRLGRILWGFARTTYWVDRHTTGSLIRILSNVVKGGITEELFSSLTLASGEGFQQATLNSVTDGTERIFGILRNDDAGNPLAVYSEFDVVPSGTRDLGGSGAKWAEAYISDGHIDDIFTNTVDRTGVIDGNSGTAATISFTFNDLHALTLTDTVDITLSGLASGRKGYLFLLTDGTARTINSWTGAGGGSILWVGGSAPALGPATGEVMEIRIWDIGLTSGGNPLYLAQQLTYS